MKIEKIKAFGENCVHYGAYDREAGKRAELERHKLEEGEVCTAKEGDEAGAPELKQEAKADAKLVPQQVFNARQSALKNATMNCGEAIPSKIVLAYAEDFEKWLLR